METPGRFRAGSRRAGTGRPVPWRLERAQIGAEGGSRTRTRLPSTVFETAASAIPPLRPKAFITVLSSVLYERPIATPPEDL